MLESWLWKRRPKDVRKKHWDHRYFRVCFALPLLFHPQTQHRPSTSANRSTDTVKGTQTQQRQTQPQPQPQIQQPQTPQKTHKHKHKHKHTHTNTNTHTQTHTQSLASYLQVDNDVILYFKSQNAKSEQNRIPIWEIVKIEKMEASPHNLPKNLQPFYKYGFRIHTADNKGFELLAEVSPIFLVFCFLVC